MTTAPKTKYMNIVTNTGTRRGRRQTIKDYKFAIMEVGDSFTVGLPNNLTKTYNLAQMRMRSNLRVQIGNGSALPWTQISVKSYYKGNQRRIRCYRVN